MVNGWQIVSENNPDKSFIGRVDWQATHALTLAYATYAGNEQLDSLPSRTRFYNQLLAKVRGWSTAGRFWGTFDVGVQTVPDSVEPGVVWGGHHRAQGALGAGWLWWAAWKGTPTGIRS